MGLLNFFRRTPGIPKGDEYISFFDLRKLLIKQCKPVFPPFLTDRYYRLVPTEELRAFLVIDETDKNTFIPEAYDCDNFARRLWGNLSIPGWADRTIGLTWSLGHEFILFVDLDREVRIVESITDEMHCFADIREGKYRPVVAIKM